MIRYLERASNAFLCGTPYRSPVEAIEAGARTLTEWCDTLDAYREDASKPEPTPVPMEGFKSSPKLVNRVLVALEAGPCTKRELDARISEYRSASVTCAVAELIRTGWVAFTGDKFSPKNKPVYYLTAQERAA